MHAHIATVYSARFLQAFTNFVRLSGQNRAFHNYTAVLNPKIEHAHVANVAAELCANTVQKNIVRDIGRAVVDRGTHLMYAPNEVIAGITKLFVRETTNHMHSVYRLIVQPHSPGAPTVWIKEIHEPGAKKSAAHE